MFCLLQEVHRTCYVKFSGATVISAQSILVRFFFFFVCVCVCVCLCSAFPDHFILHQYACQSGMQTEFWSNLDQNRRLYSLTTLSEKIAHSTVFHHLSHLSVDIQ